MFNQEIFLPDLKKYFWENSFNLDINKLERLAHFCSLLSMKNEEINLISRKDIENVVENHIFISSLISNYVPQGCRRFLDIGTGGGLPGIPFAIINTMLRGVLVDSTQKKIDAVKEFIDKLKLGNVTAENFRVESNEFIEKYSNSFDLVISRATVPLIILLRYSLPLVKSKAYILSLKGGDLSEELKTAETKYKAYIKKHTIFELAYKPTNARNEKEKKLIVIELNK